MTDAAADFHTMFQLLPREQALIVGILVVAIFGFAVKHWRDTHRRLPGKSAPPLRSPAEPPLARPSPGR